MTTGDIYLPKQATGRTYVALEDIRSAHNVGSIFRTADAVAVAGVCLIGTTPTPIDRFGRVQPDIAKTALGAEHTMPWTYYETSEAFLSAMEEAKRTIVVVEQDARAIDYKQRMVGGDAVFVFGNEVTGVSPVLRGVATQIIEIPMYGKKESLNVSVAVGVVMFRLLDEK